MSGDDVVKHEQHLFEVISGQRFLRMEGLGNEVPFFIYPFEPGGCSLRQFGRVPSPSPQDPGTGALPPRPRGREDRHS